MNSPRQGIQEITCNQLIISDGTRAGTWRRETSRIVFNESVILSLRGIVYHLYPNHANDVGYTK